MKNRLKYYIILLIISLIISIPLLNKNFYIYVDDGIQHICRLMGTYESILEGQSFSVIMSEFCNKFGYSWNIFYSPLTAYVPLIFKLFTNSFIVMIKLFMIVITILSGITMFEFINKVTKNEKIALLGSIIYILAPYRLNDMYIRMALAELTSFVFLPIIFQGLYSLFNEEKKSWGILVIGAVGLVLTHIIMCMYTAIICFIYVLINIKKLKDKIILRNLIISLLFIIFITSFFWAPLLEHKLNADYEVFKPGRMERENILIYYKLDLIDLIHTDQDSMIFEIGLVTIIGIVLSILAWEKIDKSYKKIYIFSLIVGIISIIMTLKYFPFEKLPSILKMLQFSFRMLEFSTFFLSFIVAVNFGILIRNFRLRDVFILSLIALFLVIPLNKNIKYKENIDESKLYPAVPVTKETGRVHIGCASFEYLPCKAFENLDYIKTRENKVYILSGNAQINDEEKNGTFMTFEIKNTEKDTILELPYIYYLGYEVAFENNNEKAILKTEESDNGFLQIKLDEINNGKITVRYTGTIIMKISAIVSFVTFILMIIFKIYKLIKRRKNNLEY